MAKLRRRQEPLGLQSGSCNEAAKFMYDEKKVGRKAFALEDIRKTSSVLVREQNAVPFDPNAGWKAGDLLPQYVVSREDASGSAADNKQAKGVWKDGTWTVEWARPLNLKNADDKALMEGKVYNFSCLLYTSPSPRD